MRVSDRWMFEHTGLELQRARSANDSATQVMSSGVRVNHPWDDPASAGLSATHARSRTATAPSRRGFSAAATSCRPRTTASRR